LKQFKQETLQIASFHNQKTDAGINIHFDGNSNIILRKTGEPTIVDCPEGWADQLVSMQNVGFPSNSPATLMSVCTIERPTGTNLTLDDGCPFSTPPEFTGFGSAVSPSQQSPLLV
jgi:hypothetical protein